MSIVSFPTDRQTVTHDLRHIKRITGQTELKDVLAQLTEKDIGTLKNNVFGPWPVLRDLCEQVAFAFTKDFPSSTKGEFLVSAAIREGIAAYSNCSLHDRFSKPLCFIKAMMQRLQECYLWQVIGCPLMTGRRLAWDTMSAPIPVWLRKQDFVTIEFQQLPQEMAAVPPEMWMYLACKFVPSYCHELLDRLLAQNVKAS